MQWTRAAGPLEPVAEGQTRPLLVSSIKPPGGFVFQMNLGVALATLGQRESGTARLEEAIAAFREALQERTRARRSDGP